MLVSFEEARRLSLHILEGAGVPSKHAVIQADLLLEAELRGRASHGLLRLPRVVERIRNGVTNPATRGVHEWRGDALLVVDGEMGLGPVIAFEALDRISGKARTTGVAVAAIRNNNHLGMLAWYAERVAGNGQVLVAFTTSEALVHPWGGRRAMLGTNPIAIGVPSHPHPLVVDVSTGVVSMGQIHDHAHRGQPIPAQWALDRDGNPTTDPVAAKNGAIAPFGKAKGYALGLGFEVLVSCLAGTAFGTAVVGTLDSDRVCNKGDLFIVIDARLRGDMIAQITTYLDDLRACPPTENVAAVLIPGDRAHRVRQDRLANGIPVADDVWTRLNALEAEFGSHPRSSDAVVGKSLPS
jgi:LDH2 family malate/lactate/ureidoglycolate dehydrogenase